MNHTRTALLEATRTCIARDGLAACTSREITREAGANLSAITYHFGSKDDLVAAALLDGFRTWLQPTVEVLRGDGDPASRTVAAIGALLGTFDAHRDAAAAYLQALAHAPASDELRAGIVGLWDELRRLLAADMRDLQASGQLGGWVEPEAMSAVLIAVANGFVVAGIVDPDGPPMAAQAAQFAGLLLAVRQEG